MFKRFLILTFLVLTTFFFYGCTAKVAGPTSYAVPKVTTESPDAEHARIVFYKTEPSSNMREIQINDVKIGVLGDGEPLIYDVKPGLVDIASIIPGVMEFTSGYALKGNTYRVGYRKKYLGASTLLSEEKYNKAIAYEIIETDDIDAHKEYLAKNKGTEEAQKVEAHMNILAQQNKQKELDEVAIYKNDMNNFIKVEDYAGLKKYVNANPNASYFIPDYKVRLLFIGPKGMQIGDVIQYKKKNLSDILLAAKIKTSKIPYKVFTMEEIEILQEYKISDTLIAAMIEVTTKIEDQMAQDVKQKEFLDEQRAFMAKMQENAKQNNNIQQASGSTGSLASELTKQAGKEIGKQVFNQILSNLF